MFLALRQATERGIVRPWAAVARDREFPQEGSAAYKAAADQVLIELIHRVEYAHEAEIRGITVTEKEVSRRIAEIVKGQWALDVQREYDERIEYASGFGPQGD